MSDNSGREVVAIHDAGPFRFVEANNGYFHVLRTPEGMTMIDPHHFEDFKKLMRSVLGVSPSETRVLSALEADEGEG